MSITLHVVLSPCLSSTAVILDSSHGLSSLNVPFFTI